MIQVDNNVGHQYLRPFKLHRRACSQTIFFQRRVRSNLVLRFLSSSAGTRLGSASDVRVAVIVLCAMATRCFPIHPIVFLPDCCKPRQWDAGPAKAVRAKGKTQWIWMVRNVMVKLATASEIKSRLQISSNSRFRAQAGTAKTTYQPRKNSAWVRLLNERRIGLVSFLHVETS